MSDLASYASAPAAITSRLGKEERLIWWDRPRAKLLAQREVNFGFFFGLFFLGFALFWTSSASQSGGFALFGILFVAAGVWMISAPVRAYLRAPSLAFALTDRRALVVARNEVKSFPLEQIEFVDTTSFADGSGHVYFHNELMSFGGWSTDHSGSVEKRGFLAVAQAEQVAAALLELIDKRRNLRPDTSAPTRG